MIKKQSKMEEQTNEQPPIEGEENIDAPTPPSQQQQILHDFGLDGAASRPSIPPSKSPLPQIKTEPSTNNTPRFQTPVEDSPLDQDTRNAIAAAQNEHNVRERRNSSNNTNASPAPSTTGATPNINNNATTITTTNTTTTTTTTNTATKKQGGLAKPSAATSKAPGAKKPPAKKRKTVGSEFARRSSTPASRILGGRSSATPAASSSPQPAGNSDFESDAASDDEVYCICRRPDNHTWMIGCDGGCEDWFHGKCVKINREDEDLIDKYICPPCQQKDRGVTTWKPMCRREGCRRPARLKKGFESKYCSDACGVAFMEAKLKLIRNGRKIQCRRTHKSSRQTPSHNTDNETFSSINDEEKEIEREEYEQETDQEDLGPLGGSIRSHELKALVLSVSSADEFRRLGSPTVPTPPASVNAEDIGSPQVSKKAEAATEADCFTHATAAERVRLQEIAARKDVLRARRALLKDREKVVIMTKKAGLQAAETLKVKELCGFDARLTLDEQSFRAWRASPAGTAALERGSLESEEKEDGQSNEQTQTKADDAAAPPSASAPAAAGVGADSETMCVKKRCNRHKDWQKVMMQDVRFEEADVGDEMRRIAAEEREVIDDILLRQKSAAAAAASSTSTVDDDDAAAAKGEEAGTGAVVEQQTSGKSSSSIGGQFDGNEAGWVEVVSGPDLPALLLSSSSNAAASATVPFAQQQMQEPRSSPLTAGTTARAGSDAGVTAMDVDVIVDQDQEQDGDDELAATITTRIVPTATASATAAAT